MFFKMLSYLLSLSDPQVAKYNSGGTQPCMVREKHGFLNATLHGNRTAILNAFYKHGNISANLPGDFICLYDRKPFSSAHFLLMKSHVT